MGALEHDLHGCRTTPLAHYLKALGVLRLVTAQADTSARGCWRNDHFVLHTTLGSEDLKRYFLEDYAPTPILAPWNGGSGFYASDKQDGIDAIRESQSDRLERYREAIESIERILEDLGLDKKPDATEKQALLQVCRNELSDDLLEWLDTAFVLGTDKPSYPPLLGTGGNDGHLEFTNNFMQRVVELFDADREQSRSLLSHALWDSTTSHLQTGPAIGQFLPSRAGGANATRGYDAKSLINPWDYVLMLEGVLAFPTALSRKHAHDQRGVMSAPFTVRAAGSGYGTATREDEGSSRGEIWLPVWNAPARFTEVRALMSEGRAQIQGRRARTAVDFARAVATLGTDRGLVEFHRVGFQLRNGRSYFATPLGRYSPKLGEPQPRVTLIDEIGPWLDRFRRAASDSTAPGRIGRALRRLESAILALCQDPSDIRLRETFVALGACERDTVASLRWSEKQGIRPITISSNWVHLCDDESPELRLAFALSRLEERYELKGKTINLAFRSFVEPISEGRFTSAPTPNVVWPSTGALSARLNAVIERRLILNTQPGRRKVPADLVDIADFIAERFDDQKFIDLLWACLLVRRTETTRNVLERRQRARGALPDAIYALLRLSLGQDRFWGIDKPVPVVPAIHRAARDGRGDEATRLAASRLRASGFPPAVNLVHARGLHVERAAAATLFPVSQADAGRLADRVLRPRLQESSESGEEVFENEL